MKDVCFGRGIEDECRQAQDWFAFVCLQFRVQKHTSFIKVKVHTSYTEIYLLFDYISSSSKL